MRALVLAFCLLASCRHAAPPFENEVRAFEAADRAAPPAPEGILFVGSSSIRLWSTLAEDFPGQPVINRGFGGSHLAHAVLHAERIVLPYRPRLIVVYAGTNDLAGGKSVDTVLADYLAFVRLVHARLPGTRIAYIACAPNPARWHIVDQLRALNARVAAHTRTDARLSFIDVFPHMLGADGQPRADIFRADRLHMNAKGYELWAGLIGPELSRLYGAPTARPR